MTNIIRAKLGRLLRLLSITGVFAAFCLPALLASAPASAACSALPSTLGTASLTISVPASGSYRVWVRELAQSTTGSSFYMQIPDAGLCQVVMGGATIAAGSWIWVDYRDGTTDSVIDANLTAGNHRIETAGRSAGVELDKIIVLSDVACTPTGDGTNCTQIAVGTIPPTSSVATSPVASIAPVLVGTSNSSPPLVVSGVINITPSDLPSGTTNIKYLLDGRPIPSGILDTRKLSNGAHTVEITGVAPDGKMIVQTRKIIVKNAQPSAALVFAEANRGVLTVIGALLIAVSLLWLVSHRFGLVGQLDRLLGHDHGLSAPAATSPPASTGTPVSPPQ